MGKDQRHRLSDDTQRALTRYYLDAGAGGLAVGVHTTQFAIRDVGLYEPVLELAARTARDWTDRPLAMIAGLAGRTGQACREAEIALAHGYHAGLLSLAPMKGASIDELIEHCAAVAQVIPLVGFYLQPSVGGIVLPAQAQQRCSARDVGVDKLGAQRQGLVVRRQSALLVALRLLREAVSLVPDDVRISVSYNFSPHLAHREYVYEYPNPWRNSYWGVDQRRPDGRVTAWPPAHDPATIEWIAVDKGTLGAESQALLKDLLASPEWVTVFDQANVVVAHRA